MTDERRRHPRYATRMRVWCEGAATTLYVPITNVCDGGLFVRTVSPLPAGEHVRLVLRPDDHEEIVAQGEVAWCRPRGEEGVSGMGVRLLTFEAGEDAYRRMIQRCGRRASQSSQRIEHRDVASALRDHDGGSKPEVS